MKTPIQKSIDALELLKQEALDAQQHNEYYMGKFTL